jgi:hypothetical protein
MDAEAIRPAPDDVAVIAEDLPFAPEHFTVVDLPASEWLTEEETMALHDEPAGVEKTPVAVGYVTRPENLVEAKRVRAFRSPLRNGSSPLCIFFLAVVLIKTATLCSLGSVGFGEIPDKSRKHPCGRLPRRLAILPDLNTDP